MLLNPLTFHSPKTLAELTALRAELENVKIQAGGTFLLNSLKLLKRKGSKTPEHVISLQKISELKGITVENNQLHIKSMTTINDIFDSPLLQGNWSILKTVCRNISTNPIRNMATIGGNLTCRYTWTEMPAVMIGLDATLHFTDQHNKEQLLSAEDFFKQSAKTNDILTGVSIPQQDDYTVTYQRIRKTMNVDIPLLSLLIKTKIQNKQLTDSRVSVNNCVDFAQRDYELEGFLNSSTINDQLAQTALDHVNKSIYDKRSTDYKQHMFRVSIRKGLEEICKNN